MSTAILPSPDQSVKHSSKTLGRQQTPEGCTYTVVIEDDTGEFRARVTITTAKPCLKP